MLTARRCLTMLAAGVAGAVISLAACGTALAADVPLAAGGVAARADNVNQPVLNTLDVPAAWSISGDRGKGVIVAVLDSGVYGEISGLSGAVIQPEMNLSGLSTKPSSQDWGEHGTWMASIIAGRGQDGIMGVAPEAKILSIRVIPDKNDPYYKQYEAQSEATIQKSLANGIRDAVKDGAKVISMSIGYSSASPVVAAAVQYAYSKGVVLVASAGNSGHDAGSDASDSYAPISFPAEYPGVISVGAVNGNFEAAGFSSDNLSVAVAAPGVNVPAQGRDDLPWTVEGTSPACALVAGIAALIKAQYPSLSPALVLEALTSTAQHRPSGGYSTGMGFGIVDAAKALLKAGKLAKTHPARSQVAASAKFGGGPSAVPAAPVSPRGAGQLVLFTVLAIVSLGLVVAAAAWLAALRRRLTGAEPAYAGPYPNPPGAVQPGPGTQYGSQAGGQYGSQAGGQYGSETGGQYGPQAGGQYGPQAGGQYGPQYGAQDDGWRQQ